MFVMSKSLLQEVEKSLTENRLAYFKKEILAVLDKQEEKDFQKSLSYYINELTKDYASEDIIEKGRSLPIGTIQTWNGFRYKKMPNSKWVRVYDVQDRHTETSIARLKGRVKRAESVDELYDIVMNNIHRFTDKDGKLLDIVEELRSEVDIKKVTMTEDKSNAFNNLMSFVNESNYENAKGLTREEIFQKYDNTPKTIAIIPKKYLDYLSIKNENLQCGKAYMIDHMINHHPKTPLALYKRIQYILDQSNDFYLNKITGSFILTEDYGTKKGKTCRNILVFKKDNSGNVILHKTFYDTNKNLPAKYKKINLAEKQQGFMLGADSLTAISQPKQSLDPAFGLDIQGRPNSPNIHQKTESVKFGVKKSLYSNQVYSILKSLRESA